MAEHDLNIKVNLQDDEIKNKTKNIQDDFEAIGEKAVDSFDKIDKKIVETSKKLNELKPVNLEKSFEKIDQQISELNSGLKDFDLDFGGDDIKINIDDFAKSMDKISTSTLAMSQNIKQSTDNISSSLQQTNNLNLNKLTEQINQQSQATEVLKHKLSELKISAKDLGNNLKLMGNKTITLDQSDRYFDYVTDYRNKLKTIEKLQQVITQKEQALSQNKNRLNQILAENNAIKQQSNVIDNQTQKIKSQNEILAQNKNLKEKISRMAERGGMLFAISQFAGDVNSIFNPNGKSKISSSIQNTIQSGTSYAMVGGLAGGPIGAGIGAIAGSLIGIGKSIADIRQNTIEIKKSVMESSIAWRSTLQNTFANLQNEKFLKNRSEQRKNVVSASDNDLSNNLIAKTSQLQSLENQYYNLEKTISNDPIRRQLLSNPSKNDLENLWQTISKNLSEADVYNFTQKRNEISNPKILAQEMLKIYEKSLIESNQKLKNQINVLNDDISAITSEIEKRKQLNEQIEKERLQKEAELKNAKSDFNRNILQEHDDKYFENVTLKVENLSELMSDYQNQLENALKNIDSASNLEEFNNAKSNYDLIKNRIGMIDNEIINQNNLKNVNNDEETLNNLKSAMEKLQLTKINIDNDARRGGGSVNYVGLQKNINSNVAGIYSKIGLIYNHLLSMQKSNNNNFNYAILG